MPHSTTPSQPPVFDESFLRGAIHDLRSPMAALLGYSQLVCSKNSSDMLTQTLARESERYVLETDIFCTLLGSYFPSFTVQCMPSSIGKIVQQIVESLTTMIPSRSFRYEAEGEVNGMIDERRFKLALIAATFFAHKHYPRGEVMRIVCGQDNEKVYIALLPSGTSLVVERLLPFTDISSFELQFVQRMMELHKGSALTMSSSDIPLLVLQVQS